MTLTSNNNKSVSFFFFQNYNFVLNDYVHINPVVFMLVCMLVCMLVQSQVINILRRNATSLLSFTNPYGYYFLFCLRFELDPK